MQNAEFRMQNPGGRRSLHSMICMGWKKTLKWAATWGTRRAFYVFTPVMVLCMVVAATAAENTLLDAAERGDRTSALSLLAKGADPNAPGPDGTTATMWAAAADAL